MNRILGKLIEHDRRFEKIDSELGNAKYWLVATTLATFIGMGGIVYSVGSYMGSTMSTTLAAIYGPRGTAGSDFNPAAQRHCHSCLSGSRRCARP